MADGGVAPPPPKRPSVRPPPSRPAPSLNTDGSTRMPVRKAPPIPGGRPPPPIHKPDESHVTKVNQPEPKNDTKPVVKRERNTARSSRPSSVAEKSGKRRLEITVVSARPMSEVGFRDQSAIAKPKPAIEPPKQPQGVKTSPEISPRGPPPVVPRTDVQPDIPTKPAVRPPPLPQSAPSASSNPSPVPRNRRPQPSPRPSPREQHSNGTSELPPPLIPARSMEGRGDSDKPSMPPPPLPPARAPNAPPKSPSLQQRFDSSPPSDPPAPPARVQSSPTEADSHVPVSRVTDKELTRPLMPPPARPPARVSNPENQQNDSSSSQISGRPDISSMPPPPAVPMRSPKNEKMPNAQNQPTTENGIAEEDIFPPPPPPSLMDTVDPTEEEKSFPQLPSPLKPSRPTIIRAARPSMKQKSEAKMSDVESNGLVTEKVSSHISNEIENSDISADQNVMKGAVKSPDEDGPEKLVIGRSKSGSISDSVKMFESQMNSEQNVRTETKTPVIKPPLLAPKPKPNVLPKPSKSNVSPQNLSPPQTAESVKESTSETPGLENVKKPENIKPIESSVIDAAVAPSSVSKRPPRPTIIRGPPKPKRSFSEEDQSENDATNNAQSSTEQEKVTEVVKRRVKTSDDSVVPNRPQPPLPSRRPVSIAGIPKGFSITDISLEEKPPAGTDSKLESTEPHLGKSDAVPKRPKPAARPRPVSLHFPSDSSKASQQDKDCDTSAKPKSTASEIPLPSLPPNSDPRSPQSRDDGPPPRPLPVARRHSSASSEDRGSVKPPVGRQPPPAKVQHKDPVRPPPPLKVQQRGDEETEKAKSPPLRPKAGPVRPVSMPMKSRPEDRTEMKDSEKPSRPSPITSRKPVTPPPPQDMSPPLPTRPGPDHPLYHYMMNVPHAVAQHDYDGCEPGDLSFKVDDVIVLVKKVNDLWLAGKIGEKEGMFPREFVQIIRPLPGEPLPSAPSTPSSNMAADDGQTASWDHEEDTEDFGYSGMEDLQSVKKPDLIGHGPRCLARFDFGEGGGDDLQFEEGDYVRLVGRVDDEWLRGELNGRQGIFPLAYVEIVEDLPPPVSPEMSESTGSASDVKSEESPSAGASNEFSDCSPFPSVMALYDFEAKDPGDLTIKFGDYIKVFGQVDADWLYGQCNGREGVFPAGFVDEVPESLPHYDPSNKNKKSSDSKPSRCKALFDLISTDPGDLCFTAGDIIQVLKQVGDDWWLGKLGDMEGIFPAQFVTFDLESEGSPPRHPVEAMKNLRYAHALFDFDGENESELSIKVGDKILLGETVPGDADWLSGSVNGRSGMFPRAFVSIDDS